MLNEGKKEVLHTFLFLVLRRSNNGSGASAGPPGGGGSKRLAQQQAQVDEVVDIMRQNVDKVKRQADHNQIFGRTKKRKKKNVCNDKNSRERKTDFLQRFA